MHDLGLMFIAFGAMTALCVYNIKLTLENKALKKHLIAIHECLIHYKKKN
jgi:hypothetical protein